MRRPSTLIGSVRTLKPFALVLLAQIGTGALFGGLPATLRAQDEGSRSDAAHSDAQAAEPSSTFRLVSAQVVTSSAERPPMLRLAANGPIAFRVLTAEESGMPAESRRLAVRLYGVRPGDLGASGDLAPFSVVVSPADAADTIVNVGLAGLASDAALHVRAGQRIHEIEIVAAP